MYENPGGARPLDPRCRRPCDRGLTTSLIGTLYFLDYNTVSLFAHNVKLFVFWYTIFFMFLEDCAYTSI